MLAASFGEVSTHKSKISLSPIVGPECHQSLMAEAQKISKQKLERHPRSRGFPKKTQNSKDPPGSIRDITAHLIHDKNTSIALSCTVFNFPSAGNDPGWIYWSYEFLFFRPRGLWTRRPAQTGPRGQNLGFPRFDPMILCSF